MRIRGFHPLLSRLPMQVWPHGLPGRGVTAMNETPHFAFQHAAQWWLTQALRNASGLLTTNLSEACMVWLDTCAFVSCAVGACAQLGCCRAEAKPHCRPRPTRLCPVDCPLQALLQHGVHERTRLRAAACGCRDSIQHSPAAGPPAGFAAVQGGLDCLCFWATASMPPIVSDCSRWEGAACLPSGSSGRCWGGRPAEEGAGRQEGRQLSGLECASRAVHVQDVALMLVVCRTRKRTRCKNLPCCRAEAAATLLSP